jgi:hypothetical protein
MEFLHNIHNFGYYYFYPSMWDYYKDIAVGHDGLKTWLMILNGFFCFAVGTIPMILSMNLIRNKEVANRVGTFLASVIVVPNFMLVIGRFFYYLIRGVFLSIFL